MKTIILSALAMAGLLMFTGCPVDTAYTLNTPGSERIDSKLIGTWQTSIADATVSKVEVKKADATSYTVKMLEVGELYTATGKDYTGYIAHFEGQNFIYFKSVDNMYYLQHYRFDGSNLIVSDVSLKVGGTDACTSNETYQQEVRASMKLGDYLSEPTTYTKVRE